MELDQPEPGRQRSPRSRLKRGDNPVAAQLEKPTIQRECIALREKIAAQLEKTDLPGEARDHFRNVHRELERFLFDGYPYWMDEDVAARLIRVLSDAARATRTPNTSRQGKAGRPGYSKEVKRYALELREQNPEMKARVIRNKCKTQFPNEQLPTNVDAFRR
jgi:hypothetical protein